MVILKVYIYTLWLKNGLKCFQPGITVLYSWNLNNILVQDEWDGLMFFNEANKKMAIAVAIKGSVYDQGCGQT